MKAPDKIYVSIPTRLQSDSPKYVGIAWNDKGNLTTPQIEEYIRKDALMEWAKKQRIPTEQCKLSMDIGWAAAFEELIDKLNSM